LVQNPKGAYVLILIHLIKMTCLVDTWFMVFQEVKTISYIFSHGPSAWSVNCGSITASRLYGTDTSFIFVRRIN